jgi:N-dimethylarginine dimethylaminohydrolase
MPIWQRSEEDRSLAICTYTEWDPLEEVIVGRATHARIADPDRGLFAVDYREFGSAAAIPAGPYPDRVIAETEEDLLVFVETLQQLGVAVHRPEVWDHSRRFGSPDWTTSGQYNYCPRDLFLCVDDYLIEAPMTLRCRQYETWSYKRLLIEFMRRGARWIAAPRPRLSDEAYCVDGSHPLALTEAEPVFDAANVLRLGRDLLYLVSDSGNRMGARWLQSVLGHRFRVHAYDNLYSGTHVDTTIAPIRPGLVVVCGERVTESNLPPLFADWEVIYLPEVVDIGYTGTAYASPWIGINLLMVNPKLAIVDRTQKPLIAELERRKVEVVPLQLRHARTLGGGFHCVTLDVGRRGTLESYCHGALDGGAPVLPAAPPPSGTGGRAPLRPCRRTSSPALAVPR